MSVFPLILITLLNVVFAEGMDPEIQICSDLTVDASVSADDGIDYVIRGDYYWQLSTSTGISPDFIARPLADRWPGLLGTIDAAFTVDEENFRLSTVFIKGNEWYLYKERKLLKKGTTDKWSGFPKDTIQAAFDYRFNTSLERKECPIFFIYDTDKYVRYIIQNIENPKLVTQGSAHRLGKYFYFLSLSEENPQTLKDYINVTAISSNRIDLVFFGDKGFCSAKTSVAGPPCFTQTGINVSNFFGCPRNPYPKTRIIITYSTATEKISESNLISTNIPKISEEVSTKETLDDFHSMFDFDSDPTHSPIDYLTQSSLQKDYTFNNKSKIKNKTKDKNEKQKFVTETPEAAEEIKDLPKEETNYTTFVVIAIIFVICLIALILFFVIKKKKTKNEKQVKRISSVESLGASLKSTNNPLTDDNQENRETHPLPQNSLRSKSDEALEMALQKNSSQNKGDDEEKTEPKEADQMIQTIKYKTKLADTSQK